MNMSLNEKEVLEKIRHIGICKDIDKYIKDEKVLPKYYCENESNIKAIVLGCDPSNEKGYEFKAVFGLHEEDIKKYNVNFFNDVEINLRAVGLNKSTVYVQNLCRNYFWKETGKYFNDKQFCDLYYKGGLIYNKSMYNENDWKEKIQNEYKNNKWFRVASEWINLLIKELDRIDKNKKLPVLITSQYLLLPLLKSGYEDIIEESSFYYENRSFLEHGFITQEKNKLQRTIIPLFRHCIYILDEHEMEHRIRNDNRCKGYLKYLNTFKMRNNVYREYLKSFFRLKKLL